MTTYESSNKYYNIARVNSRGYTDDEYAEVLWTVYTEFLEEDPGVEQSALHAYKESLAYDHVDHKLLRKLPTPFEGTVNRRAPLNPLASPRMGKFRKKGAQKQKKRFDPALKNNPLRGRLVMLLTSSAVLLFVFLQSLCLNKTEYAVFHDTRDNNGLIGASAEVLLKLGGLNVNNIRNKGETFRIFWAMWMHAGWIHLILNVLSQLQYLFMFEPDWGMLRVMIIYFISGVTGNLISAICNPCTTTVGSSGALFGLMGAMITYCLEYWSSIPRPRFLLGFSLVVVILSLLTGFTSKTDNWAHMGGLFGGICSSLATIPSANICGSVVKLKNKNNAYDDKSKNKSEATASYIARPKKVLRRGRLLRYCQVRFFPKYSCGRWEWIIRSIPLLALIGLWCFSFLLIYVSFEYTPVGQLTFKGFMNCECGYITGTNEWYCESVSD